MALFSIRFAIFLIVLFPAYFLFPKRYEKYQWTVLLLASYVFYAFAGLDVMVFLVTTTVSTWYGALKLGQANAWYREQAKGMETAERKALKRASTRKKRWILLAVCLLNFGILAVLKYANFFIENVNSLFGAGTIAPLDLLLPLGISFYTFQSIGYVIDVYRDKYAPDKNLLQYALFVSYFPQIIQGPIGRHSDLAHQLYAPHRFDYERLTFGLQRSLWGCFKKMVIADRIALLADTVFAGQGGEYVGFTAFIGIFLYGFQIYADFSGGMDIVFGVSEALGINLTENFRRPFFAKSVAEFWQRWHITLGAWMREYVFYPLAMSKGFGKLSRRLRARFGTYAAKTVPSCLASFVVFLLVGIWHGAAWHYVAYGLYYSVLVSGGNLFQKFFEKLRNRLRIDDKSRGWHLFQVIRTVLLCTIGRCFAHAATLGRALQIIKDMFSSFNPWVFFDGSLYTLGLDRQNFTLMLLLIVLLLAVDILQERGVHIRETIARQNIVVRWAVYYTAIFAIVIFGIYGPGYDAASFIYQKF